MCRVRRVTLETFAQARMAMPLIFCGICGTGVSERSIIGQRWKFRVPDSENPDSQVRRKINAANKKERANDDVRGYCKDAQRQIAD